MGVGLADVLQRLQGVKKSGGGYMAKRPAHEDKNASLSVTEGEAG
jgi:DNA primase